MTDRTWLLFLMQLPKTASTARVALWRKLRAAGATGVEHGAWTLPVTDIHKDLLQSLSALVKSHDGSASIFEASAHDGDAAMIARFNADRVREYEEFATRAQALLDEITKETAASKFTYAELEEVEDDLKKLETWLDRIVTRDFFVCTHQAQAVAQLAACAQSVAAFAGRVYAEAGIG